MMRKKNGDGIAVFLAAGVGLSVIARGGVAKADESQRGVYVGAAVGVATPTDLSSTLSGVNHPTKCDRLS